MKNKLFLYATVMHLSLSIPTYPRSGTGGDLQESFDKFPAPGENLMLQIPYILYRDSENMDKCPNPGDKLC